MQRPAVQPRRPQYCLAARPAREMSRRGLAWLAAIYAALFGAAALHLWLG